MKPLCPIRKSPRLTCIPSFSNLIALPSRALQEARAGVGTPLPDGRGSVNKRYSVEKTISSPSAVRIGTLGVPGQTCPCPAPGPVIPAVLQYDLPPASLR